MKIFSKLSIFAIIILTLSGCEKPFGEDPVPIYKSLNSEYAEYEESVRSLNDSKAVFTWSEYEQLLQTLSGEKFLVLPLEDMRNTFDVSKVVVGLRHDIDSNPFKAIEMAMMEKDFGVRATYFILPTASYYGTFGSLGHVRNICLDSVCKALYLTGAEIGIHNDLLTVMIEYNLDPFEFNRNEMLYFRALNIPVWGTASHGSAIAKITVPNFQIFSDFAKSDSVKYFGVSYPIGEHSLREYGFQYEAYFISYGKYYSESGGDWNDPEGLHGIISKLIESVPGDRIQILTHPEWWGKKNF